MTFIVLCDKIRYKKRVASGLLRTYFGVKSVLIYIYYSSKLHICVLYIKISCQWQRIGVYSIVKSSEELEYYKQYKSSASDCNLTQCRQLNLKI